MRQRFVTCGGCRLTGVLSALLLASLSALPRAQAAGPSVEAALKFAPIQQDIEYDQPTAADAPKCTITAEKIEGKTGWIVRDPGGRMLRRFVDTDGDNVVDLWCYYHGGIEVYRDIDTNANGKADQFRWVNTGGHRWGIDRDEDGRIDLWKAISAEEASAELVEAIANKDEKRFKALLLSAEELKGLGLGDATAKQVAQKLDAAPGRFAQAAAKATLTPKSRWVHFSATQPGTVPAGTQGSTKDMMVYENVAAMVDTDGKQTLLSVGTLVNVGDTWKLVDAPTGDADSANEISGGSGTFFQVAALRNTQAAPGPAGGDVNNEEMQKLLATLEGLEKSLAAAPDTQKAGINERRAAVLEQLMNSSRGGEARDAWAHQLADTVSAAVQSGTYPDGVKRLDELATKFDKLASDKANSDKGAADLASYFRYRALMADYSQSMQQMGVELGTVQGKWLKGLEKFVQDYPKSPDTPDAMLQLAIAQEFAGEEDKAKEWYAKIVTQFADAPVAKKAAGARRRLESVGQPLTLKGPDFQGRTIDLARFQGRVVLVQYWATWCEPCKADMETLKDLVAKYGKQGFSIIGVNVDSDRATAVDFLVKAKLPWYNLYEPGGLDGRLATELGVLTLPTMLLIDEQGKVVNRGIHSSQVEAELKKRLVKDAGK